MFKKNKLIENFLSLSSLNIVNYLVPLITLPYLIRVLGPDKYGLVVFANSLVQYFIILVDYGFSLSATKEISINREDKKRISEIFSAVFLIKLAIMFVSLLILLALILFIPLLNNNMIVYIFSFGIVIGNVFFPTFFFQGMERMKYITFINVLTQILFISSIFLFIKKPSDFIYYPLILSTGQIIAGVIGFFFAVKAFKLDLKSPKYSVIKQQLEEGWYIFISTAAYRVYTISNVFIVGIFLGNAWAGYFNVAEKLIMVARQILGIFFKVYYPHLNNLYKIGFQIYFKKWMTLAKIVVPTTLLVVILVNILPKELFVFVFDQNFEETFLLMKLLSISIITQALMNLFGMQMMLVLGYKKEYSLNYLKIVIIYLVISPILLYLFKDPYMLVYLFILTEISIVIYRLQFLMKRRIISLGNIIKIKNNRQY